MFSPPGPIEAAAQAHYANNPIPELAADKFRVLGGLTFAAVFETAPSKQLGSNIRTAPPLFSHVRADGQARWDFSLIKDFWIVERVRLQFRAECINAWNHPTLGPPNTSVTGIVSGSFGKIYSQSPSARSFQLALRLAF
jgi:hypothetical protein